ncbi:ABC transporter permease subunit [Ruegeria sp.]|uniref:ABC transporter permease n=1 Tax=Ruegeria sp. TaxID=1879320 RepID=UPI002322D4F8|nr:ABC transporter permease subunit [Ruegeria sp.]MDA7965340.1 ABC transporter permease subunit [Ruegeria sp.]
MDVLIEYLPSVLGGLWTTIGLALTSLALAVFFGIVGASCKLSHSWALQTAGGLYTTLIRGVPDLVLMLLLFFGGQIAINELGFATGLWGYIEISPFLAGSFTIGFIFGAYMTETFRGAFLAIPKGQIEAAQALGIPSSSYLRRIIWPQIIPHALPNFTNNWLVLMKTTALVSIIGLQDLVYNANQAGRASREPFLFLMVSFIVFLLLTMLSDVGLRSLSRRYSHKSGE